MFVLGLVGKKGSGKDTVADYLVEKYGYQKYAFAGRLKKVVAHLFDIPETSMSCAHQKEEIDPRWGLSPRQMMQQVGTDLVRNHYGDDFWIRHYRFWLASALSSSPHIVVSDVRFQNEADVILEQGGILLRIVRPSMNKTKKGEEDTHISETELDSLRGVHGVVENSGTFSELFDQVESFLDSIKKEK